MSASIRLLLDIQAVQSIDHKDRGIARYAVNHAAALERTGMVRGLLFNPNFPAVPDRLAKEGIREPLYWNTRRTVLDLLKDSGMVYHMMSPFELEPMTESVVPSWLIASGAPLVVTLYDLIPLVLREKYLVTRSVAKRYLRRLQILREADAVLAISQSAKEDAVCQLGLEDRRIHVIGGGVDASFHPCPDKSKGIPDALRDMGVRNPYVLSIMGDDPRKNLEGLCQAFAQLPPEVREAFDLIVVGRYRKRIEKEARFAFAHASNEVGRVLFTGSVSDEALINLYQYASLSVMPSLYEGFGLPVAEAISCGCPTLTSNTSSLPEVLDWAPAQFDPRNTKEMSALIRKGLTDDAFRSELMDVARQRAVEHTWERVAKKTWNALQDLRPRHSERRKKRTRIALIGPLPPSDTGISDYNLRAVRELAKRCDMDVFVPQLPALENRPDLPVRILPRESFGRFVNPASYDAVIYVFGNSIHHWPSLESLRKYRGIVWLHDARFYGIYVSKAMEQENAEEMRAVMKRNLLDVYGTDTPVEGQSTGLLNYSWYIENNVNLAREIVSLSDGVIAHSSHALRLIKEDAEEAFEEKPKWVLPLAFPPVRPIEKHSEKDRLILGSFGRVYPTKGPDILIDALSCMRYSHAELVFTGVVNDALKERLETHAREIGVGERVRFTGRLSSDEYAKWLSRVDIAVQIRTMENGESSAAIADCMAAGLPVITNLPSCKDFPEGSIMNLPYMFSRDDLTEKIDALAENASLRMVCGKKALEFARANSFSNVADHLIRIVEEYVSSTIPDKVTRDTSLSPYVRVL